MTYRVRSARRIAKNAKKRFIFSLLIIIFLLYATIAWILPGFVSGIGFFSDSFKDKPTLLRPVSEDATVAPPVISIPFEATNSSQINISGYALANTKVKIFLNDDLEQTVNVSDDGSFSAHDISLKTGINTIYGKTLDDKKESLASKTIQITYSSEKPKLTVDSPTDEQVVEGDAKITVSGQTSPGINIFVNNSQVIVSNEGKFSATMPLNEGDNNFVIKAVDSASNTTEISRKILYKTTPVPSPN